MDSLVDNTGKCSKGDAENAVDFKALLDSHGLTQNIDFPTHLHNHTLDLGITTSDYPGFKNIRQGDFVSDHRCILADIKFEIPAPTGRTKINYRQYNKIDYTALQSDLLQSDLIQHPSDNIDKLFRTF